MFDFDSGRYQQVIGLDRNIHIVTRKRFEILKLT